MPRFLATCPKGLGELLAEELISLGIAAKMSRGGVSFESDLEGAYRACLWSRLAGRILMPLLEAPAQDGEGMYKALLEFDWSSVMEPTQTFLFDADLGQSIGFTNSHFAALKAKDALADYFVKSHGSRPSVGRERPDLRFHLYLNRGQVSLSLDLSGDALFKRGYREAGGAAPLKENLAAALLLRARWPEVCAQGGVLIDPCCGSGTLIIEGLMMAIGAAPGLLRTHWGFYGWKGHDEALWERLIIEAEDIEQAGREKDFHLVGYDKDPRIIALAIENLNRAGLSGLAHFERRELANFQLTAEQTKRGGLILSNPPYGERLGAEEDLGPLYRLLGQKLREEAPGFSAALLLGEPALGKELGMKAIRSHEFYNGSIECKFLRFEMVAKNYPVVRTGSHPLADREPSPESAAFSNRVQKNQKRLKSWLKTENITCYRAYDKDLPEYALSVDFYGDSVQVSEYEAPKEIDAEKAQARLEDALLRLHLDLGVPKNQIFLKLRKRQRGKEQYEKTGEEGHFFEVMEGGLKFRVNLGRYLDTGLFLDHRITRAMVGKLAQGQDFLNLFCYTGTATVYAAQGGAKSTLSVDLSQTYLDWAKTNLERNGFSGAKHRFFDCDVTPWMEGEVAKLKEGKGAKKYGLIFLDPPTFSNSKAMRASFEVQEDHVKLIQMAYKMLKKGGHLIFSTNFRSFVLDQAALEPMPIEEISGKTLPPDFERNPKIHKAFLIGPKA